MKVKVTIADDCFTFQDVIDALYKKGVTAIKFKKLRIIPSDICGATVTFEYDTPSSLDEWGDEIW